MILKHGDTHKHILRRAYKKDQGVPGNDSYDKGPRWIEFFVCIVKGCTYKEASDLTHDNPGEGI